MKNWLIVSLLVIVTIILIGCTENPEGKAINLDSLSEEKTSINDMPDYQCNKTTNRGCSCSGESCWSSDDGSSISCTEGDAEISCSDHSQGSGCSCYSVGLVEDNY